MNWKDVVSSRISKVAHEDNALFILFPDGTKCKYPNLPEEKFNWFMAQPSPGRALIEIEKKHRPIKIS